MKRYGEKGIYFHTLVEVYETGFRFDGQDYAWNQVQDVKVSDPPKIACMFGAIIPRATVKLSDGKTLRINGRHIREEGVKPRFAFASSKSDAFDKLVDMFLEHHARQDTAADRLNR